MGSSLQNREVSKAETWDREAEQKAGEEEGGGGRDCIPGQE